MEKNQNKMNVIRHKAEVLEECEIVINNKTSNESLRIKAVVDTDYGLSLTTDLDNVNNFNEESKLHLILAKYFMTILEHQD